MHQSGYATLPRAKKVYSKLTPPAFAIRAGKNNDFNFA